MDIDLSRQAATSPDTEYTLTIEDALERYEHAGHPRTPRTIQRYCAQGHLECRRVETPFGEKYLISQASVARHIAYIDETRPVATSRDRSRLVAAEDSFDFRSDDQRQAPTPADAASRPTETLSRPVAAEIFTPRSDESRQPATNAAPESQPVAAHTDLRDKYIARLEGEVEFLRDEVSTKNGQIKELTERSRETNMLVGGLQRMLAPLLGTSNPFPQPPDHEPQSEMRT
jgi:hypothetical protein